MAERQVANHLLSRRTQDRALALHNIAVHEWRDGVGRGVEAAVLDACQALYSWCTFHEADARSPFGREHVTEELMHVLENLMLHETGRLDMSTIEHWRWSVVERFDLEP